MIAFVAFSLKRAWQGFWRNALMSLAATATMILMLVLLSGLIVILVGLDATIQYTEGKVEVVAYLKDSAPTSEVDRVEHDLTLMKQVKSVSYTSKEQALEDFKARQTELGRYVDFVGKNPLPASLHVKLTDPKNYLDVLAYLKDQSDVVDKAQNMESTVNAIITIANVLRTGGIIVLIVVGFTVLFIIVNTIRLAVVARAEEIEIMRLVGASDAFIRWPFIFEGALVGLLGALVTIGLLVVAQQRLVDLTSGFVGALPIQMSATLGRDLAVVVLGTGVGIGVVGSYLSVRSYLIR